MGTSALHQILKRLRRYQDHSFNNKGLTKIRPSSKESGSLLDDVAGKISQQIVLSYENNENEPKPVKL